MRSCIAEALVKLGFIEKDEKAQEGLNKEVLAAEQKFQMTRLSSIES